MLAGSSASTFTVSGNSDTVGDASGVTGGTATLMGSSDTASLSGGTVDFGASGQTIAVTGTNDTLTSNAYTGDIADVSGSGDTDALKAGTVNLDASDVSITATGTGLAVQEGSGDTGGTINFTANSTGSVSGSGTVDLGAGVNVSVATSNDTLNVTGTGAVATASNDTIDAAAGSRFSVLGNGDTVNLGTNNGDTLTLGVSDTDYVYGSNEMIVGGSGDKITIYGNNDTVDASSSDVTDKGNNDLTNGNDDTIARDGSGDTYSGSGDDYSGGTQTNPGGIDPGPTDTSTTGSYGLAAGAKRLVNVVSQYDLAHGFTKAATVADASWSTAQQAIAAGAAGSNAVAPTPFEGAQWSTPIVTWSFASNPGTAMAPVSGYIQSQYQAAIAQAFETWAKVAGITLEEVSDSADSDIRIGWGDFSTSASGVVGYTNFKGAGGVAHSDSTIRLEDPSDDALITGPGGTFTYSGTNTTLEQLALHEIGHALGLADSSDPDSVMFADLGSQNGTLDASDYQNIQTLYQSSTDAGQGTILQTMQAIAAFTGASTAMTGSSQPPPSSASMTVLTAATH